MEKMEQIDKPVIGDRHPDGREWMYQCNIGEVEALVAIPFMRWAGDVMAREGLDAGEKIIVAYVFDELTPTAARYWRRRSATSRSSSRSWPRRRRRSSTPTGSAQRSQLRLRRGCEIDNFLVRRRRRDWHSLLT